MPTTKPTAALPNLAFVIDERLSRERIQMLHRIARVLQPHAHVELLDGDVPEERVLERMKTEKYAIVLAPWYRYLQWKRVEGTFGLTRVGGPVFAGYFADEVLPHEISEGTEFSRALLLDFNRLTQSEAANLVVQLLGEATRSGLRPFLKPKTQIYKEDWFGAQGFAARADLVASLAATGTFDWKDRVNAIRVCLLAFWCLVYEEGPGKESALSGNSGAERKARFEFASDEGCYALRLIYSRPGFSIKSVLDEYWPDPSRPAAPSQLLLRFSDALRVHTVAETAEVEVTAFFFPSGPAVKSAHEIRTLWIEPLNRALLQQGEDTLNAGLPHSASESKPKATNENAQKNKDRALVEAQARVRDLTLTVQNRDKAIRELKSGGVGTAPTPPPADGEALLTAFHERYLQSRHQISELESQVARALQNRVNETEIARLNAQLTKLRQKEETWVRQLASSLAAFRKGVVKAG